MKNMKIEVGRLSMFIDIHLIFIDKHFFTPRRRFLVSYLSKTSFKIQCFQCFSGTFPAFYAIFTPFFSPILRHFCVYAIFTPK